jgi:hypothetical protein
MNNKLDSLINSNIIVSNTWISMLGELLNLSYFETIRQPRKSFSPSLDLQILDYQIIGNLCKSGNLVTYLRKD